MRTLHPQLLDTKTEDPAPDTGRHTVVLRVLSGQGRCRLCRHVEKAALSNVRSRVLRRLLTAETTDPKQQRKHSERFADWCAGS